MLARGLTDPIRKAFPSQREDYRVRVPVSGGASGGGGGSAPPTRRRHASGRRGTAAAVSRPSTVKEPYWSSHTTFLIGQVFVAILIAELYQRYLHHAGSSAHGQGRGVSADRQAATERRARAVAHPRLRRHLLRHPAPAAAVDHRIPDRRRGAVRRDAAAAVAERNLVRRTDHRTGRSVVGATEGLPDVPRGTDGSRSRSAATAGARARRREGRERARALAGAAADHRHAARGVSASSLAAAAQDARAGRARDRAPQSARGDSIDARRRQPPRRRDVVTSARGMCVRRPNRRSDRRCRAWCSSCR
jgi:hypothetical protein